MSIVGYSGLPGSGKSYGVVENVIIPALKNGRHVITNIPLKLGRFSDDFPQGKITTFTNSDAEEDPQFFDLERHPAGVIWVIDEAWRFWKSGMKSVNMPQCQKEFFTEHRHNVGPDGKTNEIVLVTQDLAQLAAFVRQLIEETYRAVKLTAIGSKTKYRIDVYLGAATGQNPGKPMRQLYGSYKPEIYQYYRSHTRNKTDFAAGMEEKADDRGNVLKHPLIKLGIPVCIGIAVFSSFKVAAYFDKGEDPDADQVQAANQGETVYQSSTQGGAVLQPIPYPDSQSRYQVNAQADQLKFEIQKDWLPLSDEWRLVGSFNDLYLIYGESGMRKIHSRNCARFKKTGESYCVINGKLVTEWSYQAPSDNRFRQPERFEYASGT